MLVGCQKERPNSLINKVQNSMGKLTRLEETHLELSKLDGIIQEFCLEKERPPRSQKEFAEYLRQHQKSLNMQAGLLGMGFDRERGRCVGKVQVRWDLMGVNLKIPIPYKKTYLK